MRFNCTIIIYVVSERLYCRRFFISKNARNYNTIYLPNKDNDVSARNPVTVLFEGRLLYCIGTGSKT